MDVRRGLVGDLEGGFFLLLWDDFPYRLMLVGELNTGNFSSLLPHGKSSELFRHKDER